ncbi:acyltransferase family protein [Streptomyces sp. NPDC102395]|uniref:acyltransferase family protein n=1 Tax=Streptomyces sp. NPDC102395 TaxID=3366168 RepID=UPI0038193F54
MFHAASSLVPSPRSSPSEKDQRRESPDRRPEQRDAFFDNAKYLAIVLVAVAHSWEPLKGGDRPLQAAYLVVYAFHMPAFIVISGYFSRRFDASPNRLKRLVTGVAVPYVVFQAGYTLFARYAGGNADQELNLLDPYYLTWFLCALFVWRLTTPVWNLLRRPLPAALAVAMLASLSPAIGDDLDLQRLLQFLPFFVLGLCLRPEHFHLARRRPARIAAVPLFALSLAFAYWAVPRMDHAWFYHRDSAQEMGAPWWVGPLMQLAMFGCSLLLTACFLALVPGRTTWFTSLGAGTLYGYLLHGFLLKSAIYAGLFEPAWLHGPLGVIAVSLTVGAAVTLLCTEPVRRVFRCVVEPRMEWAFRRDAAREARERARERERERERLRAREQRRESVSA